MKLFLVVTPTFRGIQDSLCLIPESFPSPLCEQESLFPQDISDFQVLERNPDPQAAKDAGVASGDR